MRCINEMYKKPPYLKGGPAYLEYYVSVTLDGSCEDVIVRAAGMMQAEREIAKWCKASGAYSGELKELVRSI